MPLRGGRLVVLGTSLALVMVASCTLFVDSDGLAGEPLLGPEAGTETSSVLDSSSDAATESATRPPCPANAFCDDFDDGIVGARWTQLVPIEGTVTLAEGKGRSLPNALRSLLLPGGTASGKKAQLVQSFGERTSLHCSFALWIERANEDTDIVQFFWTTDDGGQFFSWLDSFPTKTVFGRAFLPSGPYYADVDLGLLPRKTWVTVDFRTDFASIELRLDDVLVHTAPLGNGTTQHATKVKIALGGVSDSAEENEFLYDDVRCD